MILDENLTDNADFRLPDPLDERQSIKLLHHAPDRVRILEITSIHKLGKAFFMPLFIQPFRRSPLLLVRQCRISQLLQQVAVKERLDRIDKAASVEGERIRFESPAREYRHLRIARILQRLAHQCHIVRRTARSTRLKQQDRRVIGIVLARFQRSEQLADDDDGGIAHVVVHIAQPEIDRRLVRQSRHDNLIAMLFEHGTHEAEMNRCKLRRENRMRAAALLREARTLLGGRWLKRRLPAACESRDQRAQAYASRTKVADLVELDHRVDMMMAFENRLDLPRRHGIESAAEGTELYERQVFVLGDEMRRVVKACVIAPLIDDVESRTLDRQMIDGVFRQDGKTVGSDHVGYAMMNLRIDVVRPADEHDGRLLRALDLAQDAHAVITHVLLVVLKFRVGSECRLLDLALGKTFGSAEFLKKALNHALLVVKRQKRLQKFNVLFAQHVHIGADILCIGRNDRAVVVIVARMLLVDDIERDARIKNLSDALFHEIHDMSMHELRRIAEGIRRHRRHALVVERRRRLVRQHDLVAKLREEGEPERIVLVHVESARQPDRTARRGGARQPLVVGEEALVLVIVDVRRLPILALRLANAALTAVAREVLAAVAELLHGDQALIAAMPATIRTRRYRKVFQRIGSEYRRALKPLLLCENRRAIRAHETRDIGTHDITLDELFHRAQDSIVVERAALHDDMLAKLLDILELHDLKERVLDDGKSDAC